MTLAEVKKSFKIKNKTLIDDIEKQRRMLKPNNHAEWAKKEKQVFDVLSRRYGKAFESIKRTSTSNV